MNGLLNELVKIKRVKAYQAAGTTTITSDTVDLQAEGGDAVLFLTAFQTAAADNILSVQQSADDSSYSAITGGAVAPGASDEQQWVDVLSPGKRYVQAVATRGTSTVLGDIWAFIYRLRSQPANNVVAGTINGAQVIQP